MEKNIRKIVYQARLTKDEEEIEYIIKYYEPYFCHIVKRIYGEGYTEYAKNALPEIIKQFFDKNMNYDLSRYIIKKATILFSNSSSKYNEIINSDDRQVIKTYYTDYMYKKLLKSKYTDLLSEEELYKLSSVDVTNMYNNYLSSDKKSSVSAYFLSSISKKLKMYSDEEKLLLTYAKKIDIKDNIKEYFYSKYINLVQEVFHGNERSYKKTIDLVLCSEGIHKIYYDFRSTVVIGYKKYRVSEKKYVIDEIKKARNKEPFDLAMIKEHYSYIKDSVFNRFYGEVKLSKNELIDILNDKYEEYFNCGIIYIRRNINGSLPSYISTRLTYYLTSLIKRDKKYSDDELTDSIKQSFK